VNEVVARVIFVVNKGFLVCGIGQGIVVGDGDIRVLVKEIINEIGPDKPGAAGYEDG